MSSVLCFRTAISETHQSWCLYVVVVVVAAAIINCKLTDCLRKTRYLVDEISTT